MAWGRRVCIFSFYDWGWAVWSGHVGAWVVLSVAWSASCSLLVRRAQVVIFNVCYEWRICSVWQVAWERMNDCSYVIERTMQSSPLLRDGGLRNDAARAALWRTRPYECAIDVCQLLTMVIADVCRVEFSSLMFATNSGFVRFNKLRYVLALANFYEWYAYPNWCNGYPITIARYSLVENQQLVIARDYRVISFHL